MSKEDGANFICYSTIHSDMDGHIHFTEITAVKSINRFGCQVENTGESEATSFRLSAYVSMLHLPTTFLRSLTEVRNSLSDLIRPFRLSDHCDFGDM